MTQGEPSPQCLASVTIAIGPAFLPYAGPIFDRCQTIVHSSLLQYQAYQQNPEMDEPDRSFLVVALDLLAMEPEETHRLVAFVSGLVFGLQGNIDRVTAFVLLLVPPGVTAVDDVDHLTGSFYNQF